MKKFYLLLLSMLLATGLFAQCDMTPCTTPMPVSLANQACILSSQHDLDCYQGSLVPTPPSIFSIPCGSPNNGQWFAFTADTALVNFNIAASGCSDPMGMYAAIFSTSDCHVFQSVSVPCATKIKDGQLWPVVAANLVPGQVYYLYLSGNLCDYTINYAPYIGGSPVGICLPNNGSQLFTSSIPVTWELVPPTGGVFIGTPTPNQVTVQWQEVGHPKICAGNPVCPSAPHYCLETTVGEVVDTYQEVYLCPSGTVLCEGDAYSTPGTYNHMYASWLGCDSIVHCVVKPIPPVPATTEKVNLCPGKTVTCAGETFTAPGNYEVHLHTWRGCDSLVNCVVKIIPTPVPPVQQIEVCAPNTYQVCNYIHDATGVFTDTCVSASWQGCDSLVKIDLAVLDPHPEIAPPQLLPCGAAATQTLFGLNAVPSTATGVHVLPHWTGPGIVGPANQLSVKVNKPGEYCLELTHERNGHSCSRSTCVDVVQDDLGPSPPALSGPDKACPGDTSVYTLSPAGPVPSTGYLWTLPIGLNYTILNPTTLAIHWTGVASNVQVCASAYNACDTSALKCLSVQVNAPPLVVATGGQLGCDTLPTLLHALAPPVTATYVWTGPNGFFSTAANPAVTEKGIYTLLLTDTLTGCSQTDTAWVGPCCHIRAGTLDTAALSLCGPIPATLTHHGDQVLDSGDTLRFILFSDALQALGSILAWKDTPVFPFLPGTTAWDSTYYIAAIAGHLLPNDTINLADTCLSISKPVPVRWHEKPTMGVVPTPQAVCAAGCIAETFQFTGTPPFNFSWEVWQNGQPLLTRNEAVMGSEKTVQVCPAEFVPPVTGAVEFRVVQFGDKWCVCGN